MVLFVILKHNQNPHSLPLYGKEQHEHSLKSLLLCSTKESKSYMFEMTWRWVNDDRMFIYDFRWQPLTSIEWGKRNGSQWLPSTVCLPTFFNISSLVFNRRKKPTLVWNKWRISQNFKCIRIRTAIIKLWTIASERRETERRSDHQGFHPAMTPAVKVIWHEKLRSLWGEPQPLCISDQNIGKNGGMESEREKEKPKQCVCVVFLLPQQSSLCLLPPVKFTPARLQGSE